MGLKTHKEELRVPEIIIKLISTFLYRCTSSSRSYSGWVLTFIKMIPLKRAISGLSNAVPTIPSWFLDAKIYSYEFWTFFHEVFHGWSFENYCPKNLQNSWISKFDNFWSIYRMPIVDTAYESLDYVLFTTCFNIVI